MLSTLASCCRGVSLETAVGVMILPHAFNKGSGEARQRQLLGIGISDIEAAWLGHPIMRQQRFRCFHGQRGIQPLIRSERPAKQVKAAYHIRVGQRLPGGLTFGKDERQRPGGQNAVEGGQDTQ